MKIITGMLSLEGKVDGEKFIQKYLPSQKLHRLRADAETTKKVVLRRIKEIQASDSKKKKDFHPA